MNKSEYESPPQPAVCVPRPGSQGTGLKVCLPDVLAYSIEKPVTGGQHRTQSLGRAQASQLQNNSVLSDTSRRISLKTNDACERAE